MLCASFLHQTLRANRFKIPFTMKKIMIVVTLISGVFSQTHAQNAHTNYGVGSYQSGDSCTYIGYQTGALALGYKNNTAIGADALHFGGEESTAVGATSLGYGGNGCTAVGYHALRNNQREWVTYTTPESGNYNTAVGHKCLQANKFGDYNTAIGTQALYSNKASRNVAVGYRALHGNVDGQYNSAIGNEALFSNKASQNVAVGYSAMHANVDGERNSAIGTFSMYNNVGYDNTGNGHRSLYANTTGNYNTANGSMSLHSNVSGNMNTANGYSALNSNTTGYNNTATGVYSLYGNTTGHYNTADGYLALYSNTTGGYNSANGSYSLYTNSTGANNTATGYRALYSNTGSNNTAVGSYCMNANVNGVYNTAVGNYAFADNTSGNRNSAEGFRALDNNTTGSYNTAQGAHALNWVSTGSYNSALGYDAGPTLADLNNTTAVGYLAVPTASNQVRIGNTSITSIGGQVEWTAFSDGRFKRDIKEDVSGLEFIKELRPVSYTVDHARLNKFLHVHDSSSNHPEAKSIPARQTGFVAQEVEALLKKTGYVFYGVDAPENENDPYGIRYAEFVVPLVKAVQELSAEVQEQREQIQSLLARLDSKNERKANVNSHATLFQNTPNPFDKESEIKMTLPDNIGTASVIIYNLEGKQVKHIDVANRGDVIVKVSENELAAGIYLYSLIADGEVVDTKRMVLTR
jgi:trimeric autotransporter adhesin